MSGPCPVRVRVTVVGAPGPVDVTARVGTIFYPFNEDGGAGLSDDQPLPLGAASPGVSDEASRSDHRHPMPSASDVGAATPASVTSAIADAKTELRGTAPANGDTLGELHDRIAVVEALGSLATDAELIAAVTALIGSADPSGDTLGELQALIGARLAKAANLADLSNPATARTNLGLGNVDDTSDADKPVSTATQAALDLKAPLASPALTGTPTAPTAPPGTDSTQIATTAFVLANAPSATAVSTVPATTGLDPASTDVEKALTELAARPSGGGTFPTPHPLPLTSGTYSVPGFLASGIRTTLGWNGNRRLDFYPIIVQKALAVDAMQCYVYTAGGAGSLCMLGLYTADNNFKPLDKIEQSVSMNSATTGSKVATFAERVLEPGYYVLGLNVNVADATGPVMLGMGYHAPFLSGDSYSSVLSYRIPGAPFSMPDGPLAPSVESSPNSVFPMYAFLRVLRFADD